MVGRLGLRLGKGLGFTGLVRFGVWGYRVLTFRV